MSIPSRIGAFVVDCLVAFVPACLIIPVAGFYLLAGDDQGQFIARFLLLWSILPLTFFFLAIDTIQVARARPTVGRKLFSLELVRSDGSASDWTNALRRLGVMIAWPVLTILLQLPLPLLILPALGALLDKRGRAPWDLIAATEIRPAGRSALEAARPLRSSETD